MPRSECSFLYLNSLSLSLKQFYQLYLYTPGLPVLVINSSVSPFTLLSPISTVPVIALIHYQNSLLQIITVVLVLIHHIVHQNFSRVYSYHVIRFLQKLRMPLIDYHIMSNLFCLIKVLLQVSYKCPPTSPPIAFTVFVP